MAGPPYAPRIPARPVLVLLVPHSEAVHAAEPLARAYAAARELAVPVIRDDAGRAAGEDDPVARALGDAVSGAVVLSARPTPALLAMLRVAGVATPVVADAAAIGGAADVVRLALQARGAAGVGDG